MQRNIIYLFMFWLQYDRFVQLMVRLAEHPLSHKEKDFILQYRTAIASSGSKNLPVIQTCAETGRRFTTATGEYTVTCSSSGYIYLRVLSMIDQRCLQIRHSYVVLPTKDMGVICSSYMNYLQQTIDKHTRSFNQSVFLRYRY